MTFNDEVNLPKLAWWIQVDTTNPICVYFFGPYNSQDEANAAKCIHILDLTQENAQILDSQIKFCQPRQLTITEDDLNIHDLENASFQLFMNFIRPHQSKLPSK